MWRRDHAPDLQGIATLAAPILWFSRDEPLLINGEGPLPNGLPCDRPAPTGAVYYPAHAIVLRGGERVRLPAEDDARFFEKVEALTIRYFFYYRRDVGVGGHTHDMEVVDLDVRLDETGGCCEIRIATAVGFAHGVPWYQNELRLGPDTRLPLTVLVEEGTHASSPDRNADGLYTPGYDVNRRRNDAWGVWDVMGSGYLLSSGYSSTMTKIRRPETRSFPPASPDACPVPPQAPQSPDRGFLSRYELRRADTLASCPADEGHELVRMIKANKSGSAYPAAQHQSLLARSAAERLTGTSRLLPSLLVNVFKSSQENAPKTARWDLGNDFRHLLGSRWYVNTTQDFLNSDEQGLDLRTTIGGGGGRYLLRASSQYLALGGGLAWNNERYTDPLVPSKNSVEAYLGTGFMTERMKFADLLTRMTSYPSLTISGRHRINYNFNLDFNLPGDWYFRIGLFENYDSRPPSGLSKNDYGWSNG